MKGNLKYTKDYLINNCIDYKDNITEDSWKNFKNPNSQYLYLIVWNEEKQIFSWGTTSGSSDRIRKSSVLNSKLTGKYDRRVDYLMLKIIYGQPEISVFKFEDKATTYETFLKNYFKQLHCWNGINGTNRNEISKNIVADFKKTKHYFKLDEKVKIKYDNYLEKIFFAKLKHPSNPNRTFYWGDSLEPNFFKTIGFEYLEPIIEKVLSVKF